MPKVYLSIEERECNRFSDFVRGELRRKGLTHNDLAKELCLSQVAVTARINGRTAWSLKDIITTLNYLGASFTFGRAG